MDDLECAAEHIRRGGVESIQNAATKEFYEVLTNIKTPPIAYKWLMLDVPDRGTIRDLRETSMNKIADGRNLKSDQGSWLDAINAFKESIEASREIKNLCPTKAEIRFRSYQIITGVITVLSLIGAIISILL